MIVLALLLQAQSQTVCSTVAGQRVCNTTQAPSPLDYQAIMDRAGGANTQAQRQQPPRRSTVESQVAQLLRSGDCDGAKQTALDAGDVDLAAKAATICGK